MMSSGAHSVFLPTYKHLAWDYNAEDVLLIDQPAVTKRLLAVKMQSQDDERRVKCTSSPSTEDALTRVYDGGLKYGCIIAPMDHHFITTLRQMPYSGVVMAIGKRLDAEKVLSAGYNGLIHQIDRQTMGGIIAMFEDVLKLKPNQCTPLDLEWYRKKKAQNHNNHRKPALVSVVSGLGLKKRNPVRSQTTPPVPDEELHTTVAV